MSESNVRHQLKNSLERERYLRLEIEGLKAEIRGMRAQAARLQSNLDQAAVRDLTPLMHAHGGVMFNPPMTEGA